jgi:hypothetical protein
MTSLMQELAEVRKIRLQERADFLVDCQLASEARQEEVQNRANQVSQYLQDLNIIRTEQAIEDNAQRAQDVRTLTFKTRSQLKHLHKTRMRTGKADRLQRELFEADRVAEAQQDRVQRQQLVQERAALTQMQLEDYTTKTRLVQAQAQSIRLKAFRSQLKDSVWGGLSYEALSVLPVTISPKQSSKQSPEVSVAVRAKELAIAKPIAKPVEVKEISRDTPRESPKVSSKIQQFVTDYVAQLSTNSSLLEVVNDRDTVRDLLAQGANTLKVDPSDILNTLLQMEEGS